MPSTPRYLPTLCDLTRSLPALLERCRQVEQEYVAAHVELQRALGAVQRDACVFAARLPQYHASALAVAAHVSSRADDDDGGALRRRLHAQHLLLDAMRQIIAKMEAEAANFAQAHERIVG